MAIKPTATLAGEPILGKDPVSWTLIPGIQPFTGQFAVRPGAVAGLLAKAKNSVELKIGPLTIAGLSIIGTAVSADPYVAMVVVTDRRYWWPRVVVQRRYNMRRRVAPTRRGKWGGVLVPTPEVSVIAYRAYSTADGIAMPWRPLAILLDVLKRVDPEATVKAGPAPIDIPAEDLSIDTDGAGALMAVLQSLPSVMLSVTAAGEVTWDTVTSGNETGLVGTGSPLAPGAAGPEIIGRGHITPVDRSPQIPTTFHVLFTPEIELRLEALDIPGAGTTAGDSPATYLARSMVNVAPVVDFALTDTDGSEYATGTWLPVARLMAAYTARDDFHKDSMNRVIDDATLRRCMVPGRYGTDVLAEFNATANLLSDAIKTNWSQRLQSLLQHYRTTYQMPRGLTDRLIGIRPYLVATIDRLSGQRAPAMAYSDHSKAFSVIALTKKTRHESDGTLPWVDNVSGYPGFDADPSVTTLPAPATIAVLDEDQGIIQIQYWNGPFGTYMSIAPSKIKVDGKGGVPGHNLRKSQHSVIAFNGVTKGGEPPILAADSRAAVFLTVIPATTLYQISITSADIAASAGCPAALKAALATAKGGIVEIRMPASIETARIAWSQGDRSKIEATLGLTGAHPPARIIGWGGEGIGDDVVGLPAINDVLGSAGAPLEGSASLQALAIAFCTSWVSGLVGLAEGSMAGYMLPSAQIVGRVSSITHTLAPNGELTTQYGLSAAIPSFDMLAYLPRAVRRVIQKTVQ